MPDIAITPAPQVTAVPRTSGQDNPGAQATATTGSPSSDRPSTAQASGSDDAKPFSSVLKAQMKHADDAATANKDNGKAEPDTSVATDAAAAAPADAAAADPTLVIAGLALTPPQTAADAAVPQATTATATNTPPASSALAGQPAIAALGADVPASAASAKGKADGKGKDDANLAKALAKAQQAVADGARKPAAPPQADGTAAAKAADAAAALAEAPKAAPSAKPLADASAMKNTVALAAADKAATALPTHAVPAPTDVANTANPTLQLPSDTPRTADAAPLRQELPVASPLGTRAWTEDVSHQLSWMAGQGHSKAELVLTPPHLGRIEVSLSMHGDSTSAWFVSPSAAVREALDQAMPRLRESLAEAGIQLGQAQVSADSGTQRDAQAFAGRAGGSRTGHDDEIAIQPLRTTRSGTGVVDLFA